MGLLTTVSSLLRALAAYWELKSKRYEHDLREQSRARCEALEDELTELRNLGGTVESIVADRLLDRLLTEKAYFESLSDSSTSSGGGNPDTD